MASLLIVKPASVTWKGAVVSGCQTANITKTTELVDDRSDGSTYRRRPGVRDTQVIINLTFVTNNADEFTPGESGALGITGKEGRGGSNPVYTYSNCIVQSVNVNMDGSGSNVTLEAYSSDGVTSPESIT